jgi:hypothetical protein
MQREESRGRDFLTAFRPLDDTPHFYHHRLLPKDGILIIS